MTLIWLKNKGTWHNFYLPKTHHSLKGNFWHLAGMKGKGGMHKRSFKLEVELKSLPTKRCSSTNKFSLCFVFQVWNSKVAAPEVSIPFIKEPSGIPRKPSQPRQQLVAVLWVIKTFQTFHLNQHQVHYTTHTLWLMLISWVTLLHDHMKTTCFKQLELDLSMAPHRNADVNRHKKDVMKIWRFTSLQEFDHHSCGCVCVCV